MNDHTEHKVFRQKTTYYIAAFNVDDSGWRTALGYCKFHNQDEIIDFINNNITTHTWKNPEKVSQFFYNPDEFKDITLLFGREKQDIIDELARSLLVFCQRL